MFVPNAGASVFIVCALQLFPTSANACVVGVWVCSCGRRRMGGRKWRLVVARNKLASQEAVHEEDESWDFMPTLSAVNHIHESLKHWAKRHQNPVDMLVDMYKSELTPGQQAQVRGLRR